MFIDIGICDYLICSNCFDVLSPFMENNLMFLLFDHVHTHLILILLYYSISSTTNESNQQKQALEISVTTLISFALIAGGAVLIGLGRMRGPEMASTIITVCSQLTPRIVRFLTSYESHPNESSYSASNYIKMTTFRWMNTAVIMAIITPFTDTLRDGSYLIDSVYTMFYFDLALTPGLGLTDILKRGVWYSCGCV